MNQKQTKWMKTRKILLLFFTSILGFLFFSSCNGKSGKASQSDSTQQKPQAQTVPGQVAVPAVAFTSMDFPVLYVEFDQLSTLFTEPGIGLRKKIVFRFDFDGGAVNGQPTLSGFPMKINGKFTSNTDPLITLSKSTVPVPITTPFYLGNIELSNDEYKELRDSPTRRRYLVLIPIKSSVAGISNVVTYYTDFSEIVPVSLKGFRPHAVGDELNPSPPRNPS